MILKLTEAYELVDYLIL